VIPAAEDLNAPLRVVLGDLAAGKRRSLVKIDTPQVVVEAMKRAEDSNAVILRLYEAWGGTCRARLQTTLAAKRAYLCDLLERNLEEVAVDEGSIDLKLAPFQVLSLKVEA
jgi:alpha-mannosidase